MAVPCVIQGPQAPADWPGPSIAASSWAWGVPDRSPGGPGRSAGAGAQLTNIPPPVPLSALLLLLQPRPRRRPGSRKSPRHPSSTQGWASGGPSSVPASPSLGADGASTSARSRNPEATGPPGRCGAPRGGTGSVTRPQPGQLALDPELLRDLQPWASTASAIPAPCLSPWSPLWPSSVPAPALGPFRGSGVGADRLPSRDTAGGSRPRQGQAVTRERDGRTATGRRASAQAGRPRQEWREDSHASHARAVRVAAEHVCRRRLEVRDAGGRWTHPGAHRRQPPLGAGVGAGIHAAGSVHSSFLRNGGFRTP